MDDFVQSNLYSSRDEWSARLVTILTPLIIQGLKSIFKEAWNICITNNEQNKYLLCFQNMLCAIPTWNETIIEEEKARIIEKSGCNYLEDLLTCVHIIQMKILTCIRVGNKQKKIDISIPKLSTFIHKTYIHCARKVYTNVYLFEQGLPSLTVQKYNYELENLIQGCILNAIRESIPTEAIIRAYLDESIEHEEEVIIEHIDENIQPGAITDNGEKPNMNGTNNGGSMSDHLDDGDKPKFELPEEKSIPETVPTIKNMDDEPVVNRLTFNDVDHVFDGYDVQTVNAPKTIDRLEEISAARNAQRKAEMDEYDDDDEEDYQPREKLKINLDDPVSLMDLDIVDIGGGGGAGNSSDNLGDDDLKLEFDEL